ncbi:hypothetical protein [Nocardia sp. NPDC052566]|uniref:hypothetical protein n=1 Tax=Nocardia sp. NPDC052566 TaxID=3364330 RepID=UPI0037CB8EB0
MAGTVEQGQPGLPVRQSGAAETATGAGDSAAEAAFRKLRRRVSDEATARRLVAHERSRHPGADEVTLIERAIARLDNDRYRHGSI